MRPAVVQWAGRQGTQFTRTLYVTAGGIPLPLTGYTVRLTMRRWYDSPDTLLELGRDDGLVVNDGAGSIALTITAVQMADLPPSLDLPGWPWDLELVPDGDEDRAFALLTGVFPVDPEVSKVDA